MNKLLSNLSKLCAYNYIYKVCRSLLSDEQLSEQTRVGRNIALLGLFCPFFWFALLTGADASTLYFHATHSLIVFCCYNHC